VRNLSFRFPYSIAEVSIMDYLLTCECGEKIRVTRSQAGQEFLCTCGRALRVPTLRGLADLPVVGEPAAETTSSERTAWGGWRGTVLAASVALFVLFALPCAYFSLQRYQMDPSYTLESEIEAGNENFDAQNMEQLAATWFSFEAGGLGPKQKPGFYYYNRFARDREVMAMITGAIAAVFAFIAAVTWITAAKQSKSH
jgi:hypothetical protein